MSVSPVRGSGLSAVTTMRLSGRLSGKVNRMRKNRPLTGDLSATVLNPSTHSLWPSVAMVVRTVAAGTNDLPSALVSIVASAYCVHIKRLWVSRSANP